METVEDIKFSAAIAALIYNITPGSQMDAVRAMGRSFATYLRNVADKDSAAIALYTAGAAFVMCSGDADGYRSEASLAQANAGASLIVAADILFKEN